MNDPVMQKRKSKKNSQRDDVFMYLCKHPYITQMDAYTKFSAPITRLPAVIFDIRKYLQRSGSNWTVDDEWVEQQGHYGTVRFKRYFLVNNEISL